MPRFLSTKTTKALIGTVTAADAATSSTDLVAGAHQFSIMENKAEQLSTNAAAIQQIHIISSDEGGDGAALSVISNSGSHVGFAGFPSPGTTNTNNATAAPGITQSCHSSQKHSTKLLQKSPSAAVECNSKVTFIASGLDLRKRSSLQTWQTNAGNATNIEETELSQITPVKRKREPNKNAVKDSPETPPAEGNNEISLQTPPPSQQCQIVEINSNSTTHSLKQKRLLRRSAQNLYINTKCSTESSSEFPVSSPSNPQQPGCSKFLQRPPLLKNTLPADSFERHLAMITSRNPQMTLDDKMSAWLCDPDLSDVEDVNTFDDLFQRCEENKRKALKGTKNKQANATELKENYDFSHFRNVILKNLKSKLELSSKEQSDRPITSTGATAAACTTAAIAQRRLKAAHGGGDGPEKKRQHTQKKKTQSSTTPPPASSSSTSLSSGYSDNKNFEISHPHQHHPRKKSQPSKNVPKVLVYEKVLCPSSSEASQASQRDIDRATTGKNKLNIKTVDSTAATDGTAAESTNTATKLQQEKDQTPAEAGELTAAIQTNTPPLNLHWTSTDEDSFFRLNRLNREIDKPTSVQKSSCNNKHNNNDLKTGGLIQMRLDFLADKKELNLKEKIVEIFKTPTVPHKYQYPSPNNQTNHQTISPIIKNTENISSSFSPENASNSKAPDEEIVKPPNFAAAAPLPAQQLVFHQQHEFCSYLGLTGMSTANAVANAVAELAKCNLSRRSLRVRRLQHEQEKHYKDTKQRKQLEELKAKQLREVKRRENSNYNLKKGDINEVLHNSPKNEKTPEMPVEEIKNEPEIKIICHITAEKKKHVQKMSKTYVKHITAPIRKTLMQHLKRGRVSLDTSTLPRSSHSEAVEAEEADDSSSNNLCTLKPLEKSECNNILSQPKTPIKQENQSTQSPCSSRVSRHNKNLSQHDMAEDNDKGINKQLTSHNEQVQKLHMKFQEYLEESRRVKPSIYIVQSIANDKEDKKDNFFVEKALETTQEQLMTTLAKEKQKNEVVMRQSSEVLKDKCKLQHRPHSNSVISKRNAKSKLHKLLTRSVLNLSQQRQLRSRKIVILKTTVKREPVRVDQRATTKHYKNFKTKKSEHHIIPKSTTNSTNADDSKKTTVMTKNGNDTNIIVKLSAKAPPKRHRINSPPTDIDRNESNVASLHKYGTLSKATMHQLPTEHVSVYEQQLQTESNHQSTTQIKASENDIVVVSSTTNYYDETKEISTTHRTGGDGGDVGSAHVPRDTFALIKDNPSTKDVATQSVPGGIYYWSTGSNLLLNPLKTEHGKVLHIYYELDVLIVVQEMLVSFWKYSKLLNVLNIVQQQHQHTHSKQHQRQQQQREVESTSASLETLAEWLHLGECKRLIYDIEITSPYPNRICVHNSLPIYIEMRCKELQKERRDCNLLSLYINIYYYNDEDMHAKMHSIQLDSVQSLPKNVIYTTITDSRYFVMSWPQENVLGKKRSGLCKYSLTPHLDTLASIREFKSMRHEICYLECTDDDKLLGFGATQVTIWDHRSGDVLMNYDLDMNLGKNLGSIFYPSLEIGQNNIILLFQFLKSNQLVGDDVNIQSEDTSLLPSTSAEVHVIACNISHVSPSYRVLYKHVLPSPIFNEYKNVTNTGEHLIITAPNDEEIWINCGDPRMLTIVPAQCTQRFYTRGRSQLVELTERTLTVDCFANHVLKIVAATAELT